MPNNIDFFSTYYLAGMVEEIVPKKTFFKDRYFPTDPDTDIFEDNEVLVEYQDGDEEMAPFVVPRAGSIPVSRKGYEVHKYEPPLIAPARPLTIDELMKRGFGEALYSGSTPAKRADALKLKDLRDLDKRITRREEWLASQTMINNGFTAVSYIDDDTVGETFDLYYYDISGSNPAIYTVQNKWDDTGGNFWGDVEAMCGELEYRGLPAADLVVGSAVGQFISSEETAAKRLDNRRMEFGEFDPKKYGPGVSWLGKLNFTGIELDIFIVRETYKLNGVRYRYFPTKSAMVTAPGCGRMMYAQITQIEPDEKYYTYAEPRVPKFVVDRDKNSRKLTLSSRPISVPNNKAPWMYAASVLK